MADDEVWVPPLPGVAEAAAGFVAGGAARVAAPLARAAVRGALMRLFRGDVEHDIAANAADTDEGWFGPGSVTWRVHADAAMFVGGIAALLFQALHPLAMAGVSAHSDFRVDPHGRLRRTAAFVGTTAYGTSAEAAAMCARINAVHARVSGTAPDGRPFSAADPALLRWVHIAEFAAFAAAHRRFGADPMTVGDLDRYIGEVARIGRELGVADAPATWHQLTSQLDACRPELAVNEQSREVWRFLQHEAQVVLPNQARPAYAVLFRGAVACLPPLARRLWGVSRPSPPELVACRVLVRTIGALLGQPPRVAEARERGRAQ